MIHYSEVELADWDYDNFTPVELSCPCCGEIYDEDLEPVARLQAMREDLGRPVNTNSAHRCWFYNALPRIGGAPLSEHKKWAFDIDLTEQDRFAVLAAAKRAGFTGFGYYKTFLHIDCGRPRYWYGKGARELWNG